MATTRSRANSAASSCAATAASSNLPLTRKAKPRPAWLQGAAGLSSTTRGYSALAASNRPVTARLKASHPRAARSPPVLVRWNSRSPHMRLSQTCPSQRERRVELHRPLILGQGLTRSFFRVAIGIKTTLQIMLVGVDIFRPAFFRRLHFRSNRCLRLRIRGAACELTAQVSNDGLGELGLHGEHVLQIPRVVFRPELLAGVGPSEPSRDAHDVTSLAHTSLDQMRHAEFLPDLLGSGIL